MDEARNNISPQRFRIASPSETKPRRGRSRSAARDAGGASGEEVIPQISVVPFSKQRGRAREKSANDETPQMPKAKARPRPKSRAKSAEIPYVGPAADISAAADDLGTDVVPQFVAKPTAKKRGRPPKALGLEKAKTPKLIKTTYKAERSTMLKPKVPLARGRPKKVQIVEPT